MSVAEFKNDDAHCPPEYVRVHAHRIKSCTDLIFDGNLIGTLNIAGNIPPGLEGQFLRTVGGVPQWVHFNVEAKSLQFFTSFPTDLNLLASQLIVFDSQNFNNYPEVTWNGMFNVFTINEDTDLETEYKIIFDTPVTANGKIELLKNGISISESYVVAGVSETSNKAIATYLSGDTISVNYVANTPGVGNVILNPSLYSSNLLISKRH